MVVATVQQCIHHIHFRSCSLRIIIFFQLFVFIVIAAIGTWCVNYDLTVLFHKTIPMFWAFVLNLITGGGAIVLALVLKILTLLGVIH
jgi:hypothetical protein